MPSTERDDPQVDRLRQMTPAQRWAAAERLYWSMRELKAAYLRSLHPGWTDAEVDAAVRDAFRSAAG